LLPSATRMTGGAATGAVDELATGLDRDEVAREGSL
jgi:hypothetical protein